MTVDTIAGKQNSDGGWPYVRGVSWTEPTVYASLAMLAAGNREAATRGVGWLLRLQRADGGFPPQAGIDESSWVTALAATIPPELIGMAAHQRAIAWLLQSTGRESTRIYRLRQWLLGAAIPPDQQFPGWPWIPDTAAWVSPTALAILALEKEQRARPSPGIARRIHDGRKFLMNRMCTEGGWNHGGVRALGFESRPYPETTGLALAALRGVDNPELKRAIDKAHEFLKECRSADALNWLRLGLTAHHEMPADYVRPEGVECRTLPETSLRMLVGEMAKGRDLLWGSV